MLTLVPRSPASDLHRLLGPPQKNTEEQFQNSLKLMETVKFDVVNTGPLSVTPPPSALGPDSQARTLINPCSPACARFFDKTR